MAEKTWDVFISHASEDKESVALPLASALRRGGVRVWLDEQELRIGDSLTEKIDEGLSKSAFGVVVLSRAFFEKHWPRRELAGLRAREEDGRKTILPIWHGVDKSAVAEFSPILADALAANTTDGIERIAEQVVDVVFQAGSSAPSKRTPTAARRLMDLLESPPDTAALVAFLRVHARRRDLSRDGIEELRPIQLGGVEFDAFARQEGHRAGLTLISFTRMWGDPFETGEDGIPAIANAIGQAMASAASADERYRDEPDDQVRVASDIYPGSPYRHWSGKLALDFVLYAGRRRFIDADSVRHDAWSRLREQHRAITVRTYDSLVDAFLRD